MENELCTYDMACMRAELLGQDPPNKQEFEEKLAEQLKAQHDELEIEETKVLEAESENVNRTHGKMDELNSILSVTQKKINNFKKSACGSLSNIFKSQSVDKGDSTENINSESNDILVPSSSGTNMNDDSNIISDAAIKKKLNSVKNESLDLDKKLDSHLGKLDSLINKAENAEMAMASQTQQMKKFIK